MGCSLKKWVAMFCGIILILPVLMLVSINNDYQQPSSQFLVHKRKKQSHH